MTHQKIWFRNKECQILTIKDISAQINVKEQERKINLLNLLTSSVSHELMTPIRCINSFATDLMYDLRDAKSRSKAQSIFSTGKLLLAQIKMLLDKSLMENGKFQP